MRKSRTLNMAALAAITGTFGSPVVYAQQPIEEILVTATKREESQQDVPVAITALGEMALKDANVNSFNDYMQQLPNVTAGGRGPGQSTIFIRGMATDTFPVQLSGSNAPAPNTALYLDEQPVTQPGRNLDVYVTDIQRIEVLPGPQGTLFGSSSQAGTVRLITKKPRMNEFEGTVNAAISGTKDGEMSTKVEGIINVPLIDNKLAVRGVFFNDNQGGYIDNVLGTKTLENSPRFSNPNFQGGDDLSDVTFLEANNTELVEEDFNDTTYSGFRLGAKWFINDDWDLLITHMRQKLNSEGVFDYDPEVGDLDVTRFSPDKLEETWHDTAWTLNGRLEFLDIVYTGAYLDRETDQIIDYTGYADVGNYIPYYICDASVSYPGAADPSGTCQPPNLSARNQTFVTKQTHEFRVNTPSEKRIRATAGIFYDKLKLKDLGDFIYGGSQFVEGYQQGVIGFPRNAPFGFGDPDVTKQTAIDPSPRGPGVMFFNDITRTEEEIAVFGEATFQVVPNTLAATFGVRWYDIDVTLVGGANSSFGNLFAQQDVDQFGANLDVRLAPFNPAEESGAIFRGNLSWTPRDNMLFYVTWSEGFRPGGLNRGCGQGNEQFGFVPCTFDTDDVTNWEVGWKLNLFGNTLQFNGNAFFVDWSNVITSVFNPDIFFLTFNDNAADAEVKGLEGDFIWRAAQGLTINGAFSVLDTEITNVVEGAINIAPEGSELAQAPSFQAALRARYQWFIGEYSPYIQSSVRYSDSSFSSIVVQPNNRFQQDDYAVWNLRAGVQKGRWSAEVFGENLTDTRADLFINTQDADRRIFTNRPMTWGLRVSWNY